MDDLTEGFKNIYKITNVPKLRSFQYRLLHCAIVTNVHLFKWKIKNTPLCSFCHEEDENISHLFYNCPEVMKIWKEVPNICSLFTDHPISVTIKNVMLNSIASKPSNVANFLCLTTKQYIYKHKCLGRTLSTAGLREIIYHYRNLEKYVATRNNKLHIFDAKWHDN